MRRLVLIAVVTACGGPEAPKLSPQQSTELSAAAVAALRASQFAAAAEQAGTVLASQPRDAQAAAVRAIAGYQMAGHRVVHELGQIIEKADTLEFFDHTAGRAAWQSFLDQLARVDRDLAVAAGDPGFALELCLACWEHDWNHSGEIDDGDRKLFELEFDGKDGELPEGDPRRRPTFRFDSGDAEWARAMISFQRAFGELVLAYKWSELDKLFGGRVDQITIRVADPSRVKRARALILAGLDHADRCRAAYLAETDDDREWVPSPAQRNHPIPLEVDAALYDTWAAVTGDVRRLLRSEQGLSIRELARMADDELEAMVPDAYVDLGRMLAEPRDIVIRLDGDLDHPAAVEKLLRGLLGNGYQASMKPSPLPGRLRVMKDQLDRDEDTMDRKLRYLLWLN